MSLATWWDNLWTPSTAAAPGPSDASSSIIDTTTPMDPLPAAGQPVTGSVGLETVGTPAPAGTPDLSVAVDPTSVVGKAATAVSSAVGSVWSYLKALPIIAIVILSLMLGLYVWSWLPRRR